MSHENIREQLNTLGFKGMLQSFDEIIALKEEQHLPWIQILGNLLKGENAYRKTRSFMYRLGLAKLPQIKSLDNFETQELPIDAETFSKADSTKFIEEHYNILIIGGSGSGKTHLASGLAHRALQNNYRIRFYKFTELARILLTAEANNTQAHVMARLQRFHLLVIDEFGYLPIDSKASPLLFELFSNLYERVSVIITTHLTFDEWPDIFGKAKTTKAIIDRFTHHCLVLETGNKSWRLKEGKLQKH